MMKIQILNKGQGMVTAKSVSISIIASIAIVGTLGFSGCGGSETATTVAEVTQSKPDQNIKQNPVGTSVIEGRVELDIQPTDKTIKSVPDARSEIVAYNLNDNTVYKTTSDKSGYYTLAGLTAGNYQIVASSSLSTLKSVKNVYLSRDTRQTVNVILQAAGSIKGKIIANHYALTPTLRVYIPGTSYMSTVDENGNFELLNIPVGEVTLYFADMSFYNSGYTEGYPSMTERFYTKNVSVVAGKVTSLPDVNPFVITVIKAPDLKSGSTLEFQYEGVPLYLNTNVSTEEIKAKTTLVDDKNNSYPVNVGVLYEHDDYTAGFANAIRIGSQSILPAGSYTLTVALEEPYSKTITLKDKLAVWEDNDLNNGIYYREIGLTFPKKVPSDINASDITIKGDDNTTFTPVLKTLLDESNSIGLLGDFKLGTKYSVALSGNLASLYPDGLFYVNENGIFLDGLTITGTVINSIYPYNGQKDVSLLGTVSFTILHADSIDLASVKAVLDGKEYTLKNGGLSTYTNYNNLYDDREDRTFTLKGVKLHYATDYTLEVKAKNVMGDEIKKTSKFTTLTPKTVGMLPYTVGEAEFFDKLNGEAPLQAYFNVPIDATSGAILLHDDTHDKDVETQLYNGDGYNSAIRTNDTDTAYNVSFKAEELLPNTKYTMKVTGFNADDYTIADVQNTFITPSRQFAWSSIKNGTYYEAEAFNNRLAFAFFGKLTDAEKKDIVANLTITSFSKAMPSDKSHPVPLSLWETGVYAEMLYLSFAIESNKSYELHFGGETAKMLNIPDSKLTFMTVNPDLNLGAITVDVINRMYVDVSMLNPDKGYDDGNLSALEYQAKGSVNLQIPLSKHYEDGCSYDERYDVNVTKIDKWFSGEDLNITSSNAYNSWEYHGSAYNTEGGYIPGYYSCDTVYLAQFTVKAEDNSSISVTIPQDALGDGFVGQDLNKTLKVTMPVNKAYTIDNTGQYIYIEFVSPVLASDLKSHLNVVTDPDGIYRGMEFMSREYIDGDDSYATKVRLDFDKSTYSIFKFNLTGTLSFYDIATHTLKEDAIDINKTGMNFLDADLIPLKVEDGPVAEDGQREIAIVFNTKVDLDSVIKKDENGTVTSVSFELKDDENNTIAITDAKNQYDYEGDYLGLITASDLNASKVYTLKQTQTIKKLGSTQSLEAGSINTQIHFEEGEEE